VHIRKKLYQKNLLTQNKTKKMTHPKNLPIFDGHNDVLQSIYLPKDGKPRPFFELNTSGHLDLPRMQQGGFAGGFFAVFVPSGTSEDYPGGGSEGAPAEYALPFPPELDRGRAQTVTMKAVATLFQLEHQSQGQLKVVRTSNEVIECIEQQVIAAVLHFEGAEAIDTDLDALHVFYQAGLRSLGLAWSRPNAFAHGVPFKFPGTPDTGIGLSDVGCDLVRLCNELGIVVDLAHINENGFWDSAAITVKPIVVTHAGVHSLCPSTRNLTDKQLDAIGESDGLVGINFHVGFLRKDGHLDIKTPLTEILKHIDYVANRIGIDHVALGSDFDGAIMPVELSDVSAMPKLIRLLKQSGYDHDSLLKITHRNWIRILNTTWQQETR
jgi:membrane dipeptidase